MRVLVGGAAEAPPPNKRWGKPWGPCCETDPLEETLPVETVDGRPKYQATVRTCRTCRASWITAITKKEKAK